jgi:hypothetical protein
MLIEGIQQVAMKRGEILFSFFVHLSFAFCRHSPPLVLRSYDSAYRYRLGSILYGCSRSNPDLRLMGSRNDTIPVGYTGQRVGALNSRSRRVLKKSSSTTRVDLTELTHYANPGNLGTLAHAYT